MTVPKQRSQRGLLEPEQETLRQKEFLTDVIESLSHPFIVINAEDYTITMANKAAGGAAREVGMTCHALGHKKDTPCSSEEHQCPLQIVKRTKQPITIEQVRHDEGGESVYTEVHGYPIFDEDGNVVQMIEYSLDISDRKRMEAELRVAKEAAEAASFAKSEHLASIHENTSDMIVTSDMEGNIVSFNRGAELILGYQRQEVIGRHASMLFVDSAERDRLVRIVREGGNVSGRHARYRHRDGQRVVEVQLTLSLLRDETGNAVGYVGIGRDASEARRLQRALIQSEKMAAMGKLAASEAHEINNPLTGILTFAEELLEDAAQDDPARADYELILREALRCRRIVRDLLDYSRFEKPKRACIAVDSLVRRSYGLLKGQAPFRDVEFELAFADDLPEVQVDVGQIQQVFLNLIINAGDAMERRGKITIRSRLSADGRFVEVCVCDTGCGIPPEALDRIFDPFYSTKGEQGNGLGLNVVQSIVGQHGGTVAVQSQLGKGTTFVVSLPVSVEGSDTMPPPAGP